MRILYVTRRFYPEVIGGGQVSAYYIAKALKRLGNEVFVCTFTLDKYVEEEIDGIHVYRFPLNYIDIPLLSHLSNLEYMYLQMAIHTNRLIKRIRPDVVHALNIESIPAVSLTAGMIHKIPFFATINGILFTCFTQYHINQLGDTCIKCSPGKMLRCVLQVDGKTNPLRYIPRFFKWLYGLFHMWEYKFFAQRAGRLFPVSGGMKQVLINAGYRESLLTVIHNPINPQKKIETNLKERLGIQDKQVILYAGRLSESKGIQNTIAAMRDIDGAVFIVVGRGGYVEKLKELVSDYEIGDRVMFRGFVEHDEVGEYYSIADLVVLSCTYYEPLSRMLLEACSYGIPVIASDVGGNSEIVEDGVNGILLKSLKTPELVDAIKHILGNPGVYDMMSKNCRKKIEGEFAREMVGNLILSEYRSQTDL